MFAIDSIDIPLVFSPICLEIFSFSAFIRSVELISSEVKILRPQTSDSTFLIAFRNVLRCLSSGCMIPGKQRPNPYLSCLRFVPSSAQILLSSDWLKEVPRTVSGGGASTFRQLPLPFPFGPSSPLPPFPLALFLDRLEFGSGFLPFLLYPNSRNGFQASLRSIMYLVRGCWF